jgi:hypothetical protein
VTGRVEHWRRKNIAIAGGIACLSLAATICGWGLHRSDPMNSVAVAAAVGTGIFSFGLLLAEFGAHRKYIDTFAFLYFFPFLASRLVRDEHTAALLPLLFFAAAAYSYAKPVPALSDKLDPRWPCNKLTEKLRK